MATVVRYRGAVISDTSRELPPQSVAIDAGQPTLAVPTLAAKLDAQCEGLAVGTLPECIAARAIADGKLVARSVTGMRDTTHCYLAWRSDEAGRALLWWVEQLDRPDLVDRLCSSLDRVRRQRRSLPRVRRSNRARASFPSRAMRSG